MASDHRGRDLHAGKRTAQERGWDFRGADDDGFGPVYGVKSNGMNDMSFQEDYKDGGFSWSVGTHRDRRWGYPDGGPYELGRGKKRYGGGGGSSQVTGKAKTPARAMIAADAMRKRIDEGRDLWTGRPA